MKTFLHDYQTLLILIGIMAICAIGAILLLRKGIRDAKEIDDNSALLSQGEIDAFMARAKDRELSKLIDLWGKKRFYKSMSEMPDKKKASQIIMDEYDKRTPDLCCGKYEDRSVNKREFTNRSDFDSVDLEFMNTIH